MAEAADERDMFDDMLGFENQAYQQGYQEGLETGKSKAREEAFHFGKKKGVEIGQEIGFYSGMLEVISQYMFMLDLSSDKKEKVQKLVEEVSKILADLDFSSANSKEFKEKIEKIQSKSKVLFSLVKIKYQEQQGSLQFLSLIHI
eukprot:TRINITY_DN12977_c0_g2_i2.p1 TRINITY_DN12977_c0_g2~~TRINITY_DN12977_c0_g2_i2.p1  ORF type:complete len:145 (+),score=39.39 TRINITY_DN12977_c0_g2_i2:118-552(+)